MLHSVIICEAFLNVHPFLQFTFKVRTMGSLSLAWVGDGSGVSSVTTIKAFERIKEVCGFGRGCVTGLSAPGAAGFDNISGPVFYAALWPVQPLQEVRNVLNFH